MTWTPTHGTLATYNAGCRCDACKAKQRAYFQRPEVKVKRRAYLQRPEVKAKQRAYFQRPEVKAKQRAYFQRILALARLAEQRGLTAPPTSEKPDAAS